MGLQCRLEASERAHFLGWVKEGQTVFHTRVSRAGFIAKTMQSHPVRSNVSLGLAHHMEQDVSTTGLHVPLNCETGQGDGSESKGACSQAW